MQKWLEKDQRVRESLVGLGFSLISVALLGSSGNA